MNKKQKGKHYLKLFSLNVQKNHSNDTEMKKLSTEEKTYTAADVGDDPRPIFWQAAWRAGCFRPPSNAGTNCLIAAGHRNARHAWPPFEPRAGE